MILHVILVALGSFLLRPSRWRALEEFMIMEHVKLMALMLIIPRYFTQASVLLSMFSLQ